MAVLGCSACSSGGSAALDASADAAAGDASATAACPASTPAGGAACGPQGLACEYGTATVAACDTVAICNGGRWEVSPPNPGGLSCMAGSAAQCPSSFATVPVGQSCTPLGLCCDYPQGRCACDVRGGVPVADASAAATWICPSPDPGCPLPRVRLGAPCAHEGLECDYGTCAIPGATAQTCSGGLWVATPAACPG